MAPPAAPVRLLLLASSQSPPATLPRHAGRRSVVVAPVHRGVSGRLRVVRRGAADEGAGPARGEQEVKAEAAGEEPAPGRDLVTLTACLVGLLTGVCVVLFNLSVHEIRDIFWDGIPLRGASWLREEPIGEVWQRVILVPVSGGVIVGGLNALRSSIKTKSDGPMSKIKSAFRPFLKAVAASFTLGTGNSLGPEGPSVEIGSAIAKGFGNVFEWEGGKKLSLVAAGSAAGISSELPLYLLLGVFCGLVSIALSRCTSLAMETVESLQKATGLPMAGSPAFGGLIVGLLALMYPEVLYWGFENVDILLESRPFTSSLSATVLVQLIGVKILATSLCRAFGLVGGYYAPSLFIGAATGMAYGKFMRFTFTGPESLLHVPFLDVASPQAYGLVGMAATLAGVCKVPLTSVLLLFELTQDYRIVLPLLGAVGLSSWIASPQRFSKSIRKKMDSQEENSSIVQQAKNMPSQNKQISSMETADSSQELCKIESSLCVYDAEDDNMLENLTVAEAMKTNYSSVSLTTPLVEALDLMLAEKQPFVMITEGNTSGASLLALKDIQDFCKASKTIGSNAEVHEFLISHVCQAGKCKTWSVTPRMLLTTAEKIMDSHGVDHLPVISEHANHQGRGLLVGFVDRECIAIARRAMATKELLSFTDDTGKEGK